MVEDTSDRALTVVFDASHEAGEGRETALEYAIKLAASLGVHAIRTGDSARLAAGDVRGEWADVEPFLRRLALLEPSGSFDLATSLRSVPRSSQAVAIVSAGDREGVGAVAAGRSLIPGLSAVLLEGFESADRESGASETLRLAGVPTVACRQGALEEAVRAIQDATHEAARPGVGQGR